MDFANIEIRKDLREKVEEIAKEKDLKKRMVASKALEIGLSIAEF